MSTYDDEIFNYLTEVKNYKLVQEIVDIKPKLDARLKKEFIQFFLEKLKQLIKEPYEIIIEEYESNIIEIKIKKNFWKDLSIGLEIINLSNFRDYGICMIKENFKMDKLTDIINQYEKIKKNLHPDNPNWLSYKNFDFIINDFDSDSMLKILPNNREQFAIEIAKHLISYTQELEPLLEQIQKQHLNP